MPITKYLITIILIANTELSIGNDKISKQLEKDIELNETVEVYVLLKNHAHIKLKSFDNRIEKLSNSIKQLKSNATISQNNIKQLLSSLTTNYKFYWINNSFWARIQSHKVKELIASDFVIKAYSNNTTHLKTINTNYLEKTSLQTIEWNINRVSAPQVWQMGIKGQGVLIAGQDTGYQWNHASIKNKYAGWDGINVNHNYHWHDAIFNPNIDCLDTINMPISCDDHGHGTHTMGIMVGDDGQGNQIGVAPEAKWIGCRNMNQGDGTPATYTECFQFFMEPTDLNNNNPDVTKAPHIINNSWGCPISEGCVQPDVLETVVNNVVDAGILVVVAAGNTGSSCNSINTPIAIYAKALTIGSTTSSDEISSFSSQGAVVVDGSNRIKPDIVAPGSNIRSAQLNGNYINFNGTSMAAPHVVGVAALMISANPAMAGKPKILKHVLLRTSLPLSTFQTCNGVLGFDRPNNTFGWGRINALDAVNQIKDIIFLDNYEYF